MMAAHEGQAQRVRVGYDHPGADAAEQHAQPQSPVGPGADDQYGILRPGYLRSVRPSAGRQHIAHQQACSSVTAANEIQALVGVGHAYYSACPPSMRQPNAHPPLGSVQLLTSAMAAEIASIAEGLLFTVTWSPGLRGDIRACFHHSHYLHGCLTVMPGTPWVRCRGECAGHGADAGQRRAHDGVPAVLEGGTGFSMSSKRPC